MPTDVEKPATSVEIETGRHFDHDPVIQALQEKLQQYLNYPLEKISAEYQRYAYWIEGERVRVEGLEEASVETMSIEGEVIGIDFRSGNFQIHGTDGQEHDFIPGSVRIVSL